TQKARVILARVLVNYGIGEVAYPDITTKSKAQKFIDLPMEKLRMEKAEFRRLIIPQWDKEALEREASWKIEIL
ncbi:MAG: ammonia-forming cytochrome c nitrite reductase subunit c552, partial [Bacteroidia bacterium]|nr:ammonia-forming cytochrome c nitrite reductase subunit c552 [Bacteroidia bacterium]